MLFFLLKLKQMRQENILCQNIWTHHSLVWHVTVSSSLLMRDQNRDMTKNEHRCWVLDGQQHERHPEARAHTHTDTHTDTHTHTQACHSQSLPSSLSSPSHDFYWCRVERKKVKLSGCTFGSYDCRTFRYYCSDWQWSTEGLGASCGLLI